MENYNTLANCSSLISQACTVPSTTYNTTTLTALQDCQQLYTNFKAVSASEFSVDWLTGELAINISPLQTAGLQILTTALWLAPAGLTPI